jgi:hypothetical protein
VNENGINLGEMQDKLLMKKMTLCFMAMLLLFAACEKGCIRKCPKDVKPIDWNNYNDVYTVDGNYCSLYSERKQEDEGKIIKISGWKVLSADLFALSDDFNYAMYNHISGYATPPIVHIRGYLGPGLQVMLDTSDLTKKCFIKGKLSLEPIEAAMCTKAIPNEIKNLS